MVKIDRPAQSASTGGGSSAAEDANDPSKKIRPKRGQYRKYDKNALAEAVHAVRRGEMSVHRAGSFYGVPHSTLEYKVKERNLLRPKKRDLKKKLDEAGGGEASTASAAATIGDEASTIPAKAPESTTSEKNETPTTTKAKPSRSTKSKRSKRPSQAASSELSATQAPSPISSEIFNSLLEATCAPSLDLSSTTEPAPKKRKKSVAATSSVSSSPSSSSWALGNLAINSVEVPGEENASEKPQQSAESCAVENNGEFSTLKAYEAGCQAAFQYILHGLQMQSFPTSNENEASENDCDKTQAQQGNELTAKSE